MVDSCFVGGKLKVNVLMGKNEDRNIANEVFQDYLNLRSRSVLSSGLGQVSVATVQTQVIQYLLYHF